MTDVETRLRDGLAVLAEAIEPAPRSFALPPRRRWRFVVVGLAGSLALGGVAAAATGIIPEPVRDRFQEMVGWGNPDIDPDAAHLMATDELDGIRFELWVSTGDGGTTCDWVRIVEPGRPDNGGYGCRPEEALVFRSRDLWFSGSGGGDPPLSEVHGHAPRGATAVRIVYADGTEERLPVSADGWFLDARRELPKPWRSYVAYDAEGRVVARYDLP